jgi:predicted dehydrogenase
MPKKIRVGIIGVGQIGKKHLDIYKNMTGVNVIGVAGRDPDRTEEVARSYGIENWYSDFRKLLGREDIDAVDVCLHNNLHLPITIESFKAGKHVFCEKPIAGTYADGATMVQASKEYGRLLSIQIWDLFTPETKAALETINQGWVGKPYYACSAGFRRRERPFVDGYGTADFVKKESAAGGALLDMGIYHISNILYLLGNPQTLRVTGQVYQETEMDPDLRKSSGYDVEEFAAGFVQLEQGITLNILESWAAHLDSFGGSYILGSQGGVRIKPFGIFRSLGDLDINCTADLGEFEGRKHFIRENYDAYDGPQQHWIAALQGRVPLLPTAEIALNTMLISEGIYLSGRNQREATRDEIIKSSISSAKEL